MKKSISKKVVVESKNKRGFNHNFSPAGFTLVSNYVPAGDQPEAIRELVESIDNNHPVQTLLGATGTGKTFTMANVIHQIQRPTLVIAHNKLSLIHI